MLVAKRGRGGLLRGQAISSYLVMHKQTRENLQAFSHSPLHKIFFFVNSTKRKKTGNRATILTCVAKDENQTCHFVR